MGNVKNHVAVQLGKDEALVLFDWLARFNELDHTGVDDVERQTLFNLESCLEEILVEPLESDYKESVAKAKNILRDAMM